MTQHVVALSAPDDFDGWRDAARALAAQSVPADRVLWQLGAAPGDLFGGAPVAPQPGPPLRVHREFVSLARAALLHSDPERFALLYALLLRVIARPGVMGDTIDPLRRRIDRLAQAVARDKHKMRAFVRFRETGTGDARRFVAWFEPDHHITRANAAFFVARFANMRWSILTPGVSVHWDGDTLQEGPGATLADAADGDAMEKVWKQYYSAIFNPSRLNKAAMMREMPKKYWKNMPEAALIPELMAGARRRELDMIARSAAAQDRGTG